MQSTTPHDDPEDPWLPLPAEAWDESPSRERGDPDRTSASTPDAT